MNYKLDEFVSSFGLGRGIDDGETCPAGLGRGNMLGGLAAGFRLG